MASTFIIAEIAQAHDGSLGILHSYIDALAGTGVDAVKFQLHLADSESSIHEPFRTKFSYVDKTRYDYWKRMEFSFEQWKEIKVHCEEKKVEFLASPFSLKAAHWLEDLGVKRYKIASGEVANYLLLDFIAKTGKPIILSTGMSSYQEISETLSFIQKYPAYRGGSNLTVLQCTTSYPTPAEKVGLNCLSELKERFHLPFGLSDHSGEIFPALAAVSLGASVIECHAVFSKKMFGPDATSSLTIEDFSQLCRGIRFLEKSLASPIDKSSAESFKGLKEMFGKSLAVNKTLKKGQIIQQEDLETKKPAGLGLDPKSYQQVIGKRTTRELSVNEFLKESDIENG